MSDPFKKTIAFLLVVGLTTSLVLSYLNARLTFQTQRFQTARHLPVSSVSVLPSDRTLEAVTLNFNTLAADVVWIWALVYYGEHRQRDHAPRYIKQYAETIAGLDPQFHAVYEWFSATYIRTRYPVSFEDLEMVNAFLERGMEQFPTDYQLPYEAGMNYIGYSAGRSDKLRVKELTKGIKYLERAAKLDGSPSILPFTISWMYQRRRQLQQKIATGSEKDTTGYSDAQIEFLAEMYYLLDSEQSRQRIESMLSRTPRGRQALSARGRSYAKQLQEHHLTSFPYLPIGLWTTLADPPS